MVAHGSLVIIGSGSGIGSHVGAYFATKGFTKIALIARTLANLDKDKQLILKESKNATVKTYSVDITDTDKFSKVLQQVGQDLGAPEFVFFNAAQVKPTTLLEASDDDMIYDFKITNVALHNTAKWAIPQLLKLAKDNEAAKPSLLITSSLLPQQPEPSVFVLSLTKAAQFNFAQSMAMTYGSQGVHIGLVVVGGPVSPESENLNPKNIAEKTWLLFDQPRDLQQFVIEILE